MTDTVIAEGQVKFRYGKKWKTRWVVLRKPSPVADCLFVLAYKKEKKKVKKGSGQKERLSLTLEGICGVEPASGFDGVSYSLSILCITNTLVLGFHSRDALQAWDTRMRYHLGEVHRFSVNVEPGTKLESGPASLHLCNNLLVLAKGLPPVVSGHWKLSTLRRYGAVPNGFVFEGGSRCGYWAGVFYLSCSDGEQISFLFDCIVRGIAPSRTPQGLAPAPSDPNPVSKEEQILQETSELEKRLSRLSNCSLASSTASTFSCSTSVAGDDHSSISSSSSSQSEASFGCRLPHWHESLSRLQSNDAASSCSTLKALTGSDDRLYAAVTGSTRPSSAQLQSRGLHDSGRQSSLDSGIGIATCSQSSGSFSSYTGSLDTAIVTGAEEFGSAASLTSPFLSAPPLTPPPPPPTVAPPTPVPDNDAPPTPVPDPAPSTCPSSSSSRCSTRLSRQRSDEYCLPSLLRLRYDTPRSLLQRLTCRETPTPSTPSGPDRNSPNTGGQGQWWSSGAPGSKGQRYNSWGSEGSFTPRPQSVPVSLVYGQKQCSHASDNYITPEQWRSVGNKSSVQVEKSASECTPLSFKPDERNNNGALGNMLERLKISMPSLPPPAPLALPARPITSCGFVRSNSEASNSPFLDPGLYLHNTVHYVNIPISSMLSKGAMDLLCSELNLPNPARVSSLQAALGVPRPEEGISSGFAHLNTVTMETAQSLGAEPGQSGEDRLTQNRRPGGPT